MPDRRPSLWLSLWFAQLGLELAALGADDAEGPAPRTDAPRTAGAGGTPSPVPLVLVEQRQQRQLLQAVNAAAAAAGLRRGQTLAQAQALCAQLRTLQRDRVAEQRALQHLAACAYRYSSEVRIDSHPGLLLEIGRSLGLHARHANRHDRHAALLALLLRLRGDLLALGFQPAAGLGRTPAAARLRARLAAAGDVRCAFQAASTDPPTLSMPALDPLPIERLPWPAALRESIGGVGIRHLGSLRRLPRASLQRRHGKALTDLLAQLEGRLPESAPSWQPAAQYHGSLELPAPTSQGEALRFPLRRLLDELCLALQARDASVDRLQIQFTLEADHSEDSGGRAPRRQRRGAMATSHAGQCTLQLELLQGSRDPRQMLELLLQRLQREPLCGRILAISLRAAHLPLHRPLQQDLFDRKGIEAQEWSRLLERLQARLGSEALQAVRSHPDHRPELATQLLALNAAVAPAAAADHPDGWPEELRQELRQWPLWLLPSPVPIDPATLRIDGPVMRVEGGWWSGHDIRRDYLPAVDAHGARCWIYRELRTPWQTCLHGWFG